ncbi:MAG: sigma-E factor negative regulatory protein [Gammaproteobacteria bacterium]
MTANAHEQLSALLDGELPDAEVAMVVRRIGRDEALRDAALRYRLIGDTLRDELPARRPADLVARVRSELAAEPAAVPAAAAPRGFHRFARYGAGVAVAASVAMVALVALPGGQQEAPPPVLSATEVASPVPEQRMLLQPGYTRAAGGGPDRLTRYYVNHAEYAPPMTGRGALTRIIVIQPEPTQGADNDAEVTAEASEEPGNAQ